MSGGGSLGRPGVTITLNGRQVAAEQGELVIRAAERHGSYIPHFCYHPRLAPVGMCRMCLVEIDTGRGPTLEPACMLAVAEGMVVETESPAARKAQEGVLEFLLLNHPLDCPVCDKGGECPLQDQTMAHGPGESRFVEEKRIFEKPIAISDLVLLDRERCILCDRCTRFASEVAGDPLISFLDRGAHTQVNIFPGHRFASYFSGNTVQICPVGALLASPYRFKARPWDLDSVESTCTTCSVGCRIVVDTSRNQVIRYSGVDTDPVNWGWLCDRGRFNYEAVHHPERLAEPLVRCEGSAATEQPGRGSASSPPGDGVWGRSPQRGPSDGQLQPATWDAALSAAAAAIAAALDRNGPPAVAVVGGARLTNEDAYAWAKLAKGVIGTDNVDAQLGDGLPADAVLGLPRATIDDLCVPGGRVLLIGPDLKEELPVLYLRLRHAVRNDGVKVVELTTLLGENSELAEVSVLHRPGDTAAVVHALLGHAHPQGLPQGVDAAALARAAELLGGGGFTVLLGRHNLAASAATVLAAAAAITQARPETRYLSALRRGNVHGALDMGLAPGMLPGRVPLAEGREWFAAAGWPALPTMAGLDTAGVLQAAAEGRIEALVLLGADPLSDFPDRDLAQRGLAGARTVISCDLFATASSAQADIVLPAAGFAETPGTTTNLEGRISTLGRAVTPPGTARSDWMIAAELARRLGGDLGLESVEGIWAEIEALAPSHSGITYDRIAREGARDGVLAPVRPLPAPPAGEPSVRRPGPVVFEPGELPATPRTDAYSLRLVASRRLYDCATGTQHSPSLAHLAAAPALALHPKDFDRLGVAPGDAVTVSSAKGAITLPAKRDPAVAPGVAALPFNQPGAGAAELIDSTALVTDVRVARP